MARGWWSVKARLCTASQRRYHRAMTTPDQPSPAQERERRLAEALRANLRRRKDAARNNGPTPPTDQRER